MSIKSIECLHLGRTRKVERWSFAKVLEQLDQSFLQALTSPLLWSRALDLTTSFSWLQEKLSPHFPCSAGTSFPLRQMIYVTSVVEDKPARLSGGGLAWSKRTDIELSSHCVDNPLEDALLSTNKLASFLPAAIARLSTAQEHQMDSHPVSNIVLGITKLAAIDLSPGSLGDSVILELTVARTTSP
jgi:hypothetical protein